MLHYVRYTGNHIRRSSSGYVKNVLWPIRVFLALRARDDIQTECHPEELRDEGYPGHLFLIPDSWSDESLLFHILGIARSAGLG